MTTATRYEVRLPPLHKGRDGKTGQIEVFNHPARFKIVICGRRWGKTTLGVLLCLRYGLQGKVAWWVAPTYPIASIGWRMLKRIASQIPDVEIREADREVIFPGGGRVQVKSADNPDSLRGEGLDFVVLDECAQIRQIAWTEALRAALSDKKGGALFIGTPKGKDWIYNLWRAAEGRPDWARWQKPTIDNPFIDPEEIEQARRELPESIFKQEYEADFGASQLMVYPEFDREFHQWKWPIPRFDALFGGLDFGGTSIGSHKSSGILAGYIAFTDTLVAVEEFEEAGPNIAERQLNWMFEAESRVKVSQRVLFKDSRLTNTAWNADKTQMTFIQIMRNAGVSIYPTKGGPGSVQSGIDLVKKRLNVRGDGKARLYYAPSLKALPDAFERYRYADFTEEDDKRQPDIPLKVNDDTIDAFRYLVEGRDRQVIGDPMEMFKNQLGVIR